MISIVISQPTNIVLHNWSLLRNAGPAWNTLRPYFYAPLLHEFFLNAPYQFTQLPNLRHLILAIGLFGWCIPFIEAFFSHRNIFFYFGPFYIRPFVWEHM